MGKDGHQMTSQLPRVLLQMNPGLTRQLSRKLSLLDKLREKRTKSGDSHRRRFTAEFERRREFRQKLYKRHYRMDEETRKVVDNIKAKQSRLIQQYEEMEREREQERQLTRRGDRDRQRRSSSGSSRLSPHPRKASVDDDDDDEEEDVGVTRPWTPTSAIGSERWGSRRSSVADTPAGAFGMHSLMSSRRSSLKSVSVLELEGLAQPGSPGPPHTEETLDSSAAGGAVAAKPEVVVTQARPTSPSSSPSRQEEEEQTKLTGAEKFLNLLPAPTPTRFVGRMHSVVSSGSRRQSRDNSRKSSIVPPETIQEDETSSQAGSVASAAAADKSGDGSADQPPSGRSSRQGSARSGSGRKMTIYDLALGTGMPTSTRFVGKLIRDSAARESSASSRRNAWRAGSSGQSSRDSRDSPVTAQTAFRKVSGTGSQVASSKRPVAGSGGSSALAAMSKIASKLARSKSRMSLQKGKAVGGAAGAGGGAGSIGEDGERARRDQVSGIKRIEKRTLRFYQKSSQEILDAFGTVDIHAKNGVSEEAYLSGRQSRSHLPNEEDLIVPGMKRHLYLDRRAETVGSVGRGAGAGGDQSLGHGAAGDDDASSLLLQSQQSSIDAGGSMESKEQATIANALGWMKKRSDSNQSLSVKPAASKLMGKLHEMRGAGHPGDRPGTPASGAAADLELDEKWDWMTGVPTSVRFLAKSWRPINRGPGGIITVAPGSTKARVGQDFSATVNMLTLLAKADMKLKTSGRHEDGDDSASGLSDGGRGTGHGKGRRSRRRQGHGGGGRGRRPRSKSKSASTSKSGSLLGRHRGSREDESDVKSDGEPRSESGVDRDEALTRLFSGLVLVHPPSIPRWNVDKSVQEEKGGEPFMLLQRHQDVLKEAEVYQTEDRNERPRIVEY